MRSIGAAFLIAGTLGTDNMLTVFIPPPLVLFLGEMGNQGGPR